MHVTSLKKELRFLRYYALGTTLLAGFALLGAAGATYEVRNATFNTVTARRLVIRDNENKLAMVLTNHDNPMPGIWAGMKTYRHGGGGNEIIFYDEMGDEQGGYVWSGQIHPDGTYNSSLVNSYDSVTTDELLQVHDGNDNGKTFSYVTGWNEPNMRTGLALRVIREYEAAQQRNAGAAQLQAILAQDPAMSHGQITRYLVGYDATNTAQVLLADGQGHPRIKMFVRPNGTAALQFLDAAGKVITQYPPSH
ncbi:MAG TPA: hypothetical protein VFE36_13995 [Candidatus Baltobacteraceae bacterium]|jgi:hypothetical protein|nr:hypothetical protein [Candidatus Baltobacteraceae bacterium]